MMQRVFLIIFSVLSSYFSLAQQDPMFTQYMFNTQAVNPAYAGSRDALSIVGISRWQWLGIDGAPTTQSLTANMPILDNLGVGASLYYDQIGPTKQVLFFGDFAYKLQLSREGTLAFGLKLGFQSITNDLPSLDGVQGQTGFETATSDILPNVGAGAYYYEERFYFGVSAPKMIENSINASDEAKQVRHYFAIAGYVLDVSKYVKFKPSILFRYVQSAPLTADLSANFLFWDKLWLGANYRTRDALGMIAQFQLTSKLRAGYAYEYPLTSINQALDSPVAATHELMVGFDLPVGSRTRYRSIRYF